MATTPVASSVPQYDGNPVAFLDKPAVLTLGQAQKIEAALSQILRQVEDFTTQALKDPSLLKALNVPEDLDPTPTPLGLHIPFARFDFLFDGEKIDILELNTDGTSGYNVMEWIAQQSRIPDNENPNLNLSMRLLQALREHKPEAKEICLMDFRGIETSWEQHDLVKRWSPQIASQLADPMIRSWKPGALVYRRALSWQLRSHQDKAQAFLKDWREKNITVVGGWSSDVGMSKAWPAFIKPAHCPETLLLDEAVVKILSAEKDGWVLKGALSFSGQAVIRGIDLKQERWQASLEQVLKESLQGRRWIAQRRIIIPKIDGRPFELGLYFLNGKPSGYMCRWGHDQAITATSDEVLRAVRITAKP